MLLDLIEKLIDRCIGLVKEHKETKRRLLGDFVEPINDEFQQIHEGYIDSFMLYRSILGQDRIFSEIVVEVRDKVNADNLFTSGQRAKLLQFGQLKLENEEIFGKYLWHVAWYLGVAYAELFGEDAAERVFPMIMESQVYRNSLADKLREIGERHDLDDAGKRSLATMELDHIVEILQTRYSRVCKAHLQLKEKLLK